MSKFKEGDRVVFVDSYEVTGRAFKNLKGIIGIVTACGAYLISWTPDGETKGYASGKDQLELDKNYIVSSILKDL